MSSPELSGRLRERRIALSGAKFALHYLPLGLALGFYPAVLRAVALLWKHNHPLKPNGLFLVFLALALGFAWQVTSTASFLVTRFRGERRAVREHIAFGLHSCPKVLLSYGLLFGAVTLSVLGAFGSDGFSSGVRSILSTSLVLSVFLLWAPAFVAAENFAKPPAEPDFEEDFDPFDDESFERDARLLKPRFFSGMGFLDIGIDRSIQFTIRHFGIAVEVILLVWCVDVLPQALSILLFGTSDSAGAVIFQTLAGSALFGGVLLYVGYTFFMLLPKEAREELSVSPDTSMGGEWLPSSFLSRGITVALVLIAFLATGYIFDSERDQAAFPSALERRGFRVERAGEQLKISFRLHDTAARYRWFHAQRFALEVKNPVVQVVSDATPKKEGIVAALEKSLSEEPQTKFLPTDDILLRDQNGEILDERYLSPFDGELQVELSFDIRGIDATGAKLVYRNIGEDSDLLAELPNLAEVK